MHHKGHLVKKVLMPIMFLSLKEITLVRMEFQLKWLQIN